MQLLFTRWRRTHHSMVHSLARLKLCSWFAHGKRIVSISGHYVRCILSSHSAFSHVTFHSIQFFFPQIHLSLIQGRPATKANITSTELLDFTLARFVRMRFQGMHTTSHSSNSIQWLVERTELNKRSFYSLRFIKIGARLDCGGHANEAKNFNSKDVIECNCAHNTCGVNCEKCCPLYNQRPYKAATYTDANPCEQCEVCPQFHHFFRCCLLHLKCSRSRPAKCIFTFRFFVVVVVAIS